MERDTRTFRLRPHRGDGYSSPCRRVKKSALVRTITTSCSAGLLRRNVTKGTCCQAAPPETRSEEQNGFRAAGFAKVNARDRKSTRLNSSHGYISYAVFCLKKKKTQ